MKTIITCALSLISFLGMAQDQKLRVFGGFGFTPTETSTGDLLIRYTDESPSQDNLYNEVFIQAQKRGLNIGAGLDYVTAQNLVLRGGFEGSFGQCKSFELDLAVGFEKLVKEKFYIRPFASLSFGSAWIKLGDIYQNDLYIEVNGTQFYSNSVEIQLSRNHTVFTPEIELAYPLQYDGVEIFGNLGYQLPIRIQQNHLYFYGEDDNNASINAKESINVHNLDLHLDSNEIRSNFIGVKGIVFSLGVSFEL
jgi:hypothetical protein